MDYYEDDRSRVFFSRSVMIKTPVDGETPSAFVTAAASAPQIASPFSETSTLAANILSSRESTTTPDTRTTRNESTTRNGSTSREASAPKAPTAFRDSSIARKPLPPVPQIHPSVQNSIGMTTPEHSPNPNPSKGPFGQSYEDAIEIEHSRRLAAERQQEKWERINQLQERSSSRTMGESGGSPDPDPNRGPLGQSYEDAIEIERSRRLAAERQQEKWERTNQLQGRSRTWGESGGSQIVNNIFNPISQSTAYHSIHGTNSNYDRRVVREEMVPLTPLIDNGEVEESGDLGYRRHRSHHGVVVDANEQPSAEEEARLRHLYFPRENSSLDSNDPSFKKFEGAIGEGWDGPNDPENPANFSDKKKLWIYLSICLMAFFASNSVSLMIPSVTGIMMEFKISEEMATLGLGLYLLGWTFGPLIWVPFSEIFGKAPVIKLAWLPFIWFSAGSALSKSTTQLLVTRSLAGIFSCAHVILGASFISDIYTGPKAATLTGIYVILLYLSPSLAPLIAGYLVENTSWRWAFWFNVIQCCAVLPCVFMVPETHTATILAKKRKRRLRVAGILDIPIVPGEMRKRKKFVKLFFLPVKILFTEPLMLAISLSGGISSSLLYLYFGVYPHIFLIDYRFTISKAFAPFGAIVIGMLLAAPTTLIQKKIIEKRDRKRGGVPHPEDQLLFGLIAAFVTPGSIFWFAYTANPRFHWTIPAASGIPFGWGIMTLFTTQLVYAAQSYASMVSTVAASLFLIRNLLGATLPLAIPTMAKELGHKMTIVVMAAIAAGVIPIPLVLYKYGEKIRLRSALAAKF